MRKFNIGDKLYIVGEKRPYHVRVCDDRFVICTKPYNPQRTVLYFIIDLKDNWRGPDNMIFCSGYETNEDCNARLKELQDGTIEVSAKCGKKLEFVDYDVVR